MNKIKETIKMLISKEFILFVIIGVINTFSTSILSACYSKVLGQVSAFVPGYISGILIAYTLNSIFTFKEKLKLSRLIKYAVSTIPNFIIQFIVVYIGVNLLHIDHFICYIAAAIIGVPVTFLILRLFVFIKK